jgi:hypothetical protein
MGRNADIARDLLDNSRDLSKYAEPNRVYLQCPYDERDRVKAVGGMWDKIQKKWYIPKDVDALPFQRWLPERKQTYGKSKNTSVGTFLLSVGKKKSSAHLWNGVDTVCRLYSTGGMSKKKKQVTTTTYGRPVCSLCLSVNSKRKHPVLFQDADYTKDKDEFVMQLPNI